MRFIRPFILLAMRREVNDFFVQVLGDPHLESVAEEELDEDADCEGITVQTTKLS